MVGRETNSKSHCLRLIYFNIYKAPEKQRWRALLEPLELEIPAVDIAQVRYRRYRPVQARIPKSSVVGTATGSGRYYSRR
eukprot:SAG31_NODE_998_length_10460_cov_255.143505_2_plen_80_part_00